MSDLNLAPGVRVEDVYSDGIDCTNCPHTDHQHDFVDGICTADDCPCPAFEPYYGADEDFMRDAA